MRIALIDNMNNNFFAITRYFRDLGINAVLYKIPGSGHDHFDPQEDSYEDLSSVSWIKDFPVPYGKRSYFLPIKRVLQEEFAQYDRIITCGPATGLMARAGIVSDLFIPYGSDLFLLPFSRALEKVPLKPRAIAGYLMDRVRGYWQAKGIREAKKVISNSNWDVAENAASKLGVESLNLPRLMVYKERLSNHSSGLFEFFKDHDYVLFSPTRHMWKTEEEKIPGFKEFGGAKRNDRLIKAFARVVKGKLFCNPVLVLVEFGHDVDNSKQLINSLGISNKVVWLPLMSRKQIVEAIKLADFVGDQFRIGMSATSAGTTNEALAYGTPVIANTDGAIYEPDDPYYQSPILQAVSEDEIYFYLEDYASDQGKYKEIGRQSINWFDANLGSGLARAYLELLR